MPAYDKNGMNLNGVAYDKSGVNLSQAYDISGNPLFTSSGSNLTIMTYNIGRWGDSSSVESLQAEIFNTYEPDIICFQEFQRWQETPGIPAIAQRLLTDYPYKYMASDANRHAVASKINLQDYTIHQHITQDVYGHSYSTATITVGGKDILLVNVHLATSEYEDVKMAEAGEIFDVVRNSDSFIICGDFNTVCKSVDHAEYVTMIKPFVDAGFNLANCNPTRGFNNTWSGGTSYADVWYPCDHIITSPNITMNSVVFDQRKVLANTGLIIDHIPVIAYLTVT